MGLITKALQEKADMDGVPKRDRKTYAELFVKRVLNKTIVEGDGPLIKEIIQQLDGAPTKKVTLAGKIETLNSFDDDQLRRVAMVIAGEDDE